MKMELLTSEESATVFKMESCDPYIVKTETFVEFDTCQNQQIENELHDQVNTNMTKDKIKTEPVECQTEPCELMNNETLHHNQLKTESCELVNNETLHHNQLKTESCELVNIGEQ
jgi:hypothetical protein